MFCPREKWDESKNAVFLVQPHFPRGQNNPTETLATQAIAGYNKRKRTSWCLIQLKAEQNRSFFRFVDLRCAHLFNLLGLVGLSSHLQMNWRTWIEFPILNEETIKRIQLELRTGDNLKACRTSGLARQRARRDTRARSATVNTKRGRRKDVSLLWKHGRGTLLVRIS